MYNILKRISVIFFILIVWLAGFCVFNRHINSYKIDNTTKTDAIVTVTGGKNRLAESIKLLNMGLADKLFISGVSHSTNIKDIENVSGVKVNSLDNVVLGYEAQNTVGNAIETVKWIKENNIKSIRLVTSYYHIPRTLQEFKSKKDLNIDIIEHPVYSINVAHDWWNKWGTFKLIALEYNKFLCAYFINLFK